MAAKTNNGEIAYRLNLALTGRGLRPIDLSKKTGISKASISQYMSGKYCPPAQNAEKIGSVLRVSPLWLLAYEGAEEPDFLAYQPAEVKDPRLDQLLSTFIALNEDGQKMLLQYAEFLRQQYGK